MVKSQYRKSKENLRNIVNEYIYSMCKRKDNVSLSRCIYKYNSSQSNFSPQHVANRLDLNFLLIGDI